MKITFDSTPSCLTSDDLKDYFLLAAKIINSQSLSPSLSLSLAYTQMKSQELLMVYITCVQANGSVNTNLYREIFDNKHIRQSCSLQHMPNQYCSSRSVSGSINQTAQTTRKTNKP